MHLLGEGRDLATGRDGSGEVIGTARYQAVIDFYGGRKVATISTEPGRPVDPLVGVSAASGFRGVLEETLPEDRAERSLLYLLLDDLPVATLVSGFALGWAGAKPHRDKKSMLINVDLCAGWRDGGTIVEAIQQGVGSPVVTGPLATSLLSDDPLAWHSLTPMPGHAVRRHRRLDLVDGDPLSINALFRDTHMSPLGSETIIHEYTINGSVDPSTMTFTALDARPQVLPYLECPIAAESASRLVGSRVEDLRRYVRTDFVGITTCTHLNDTLRSIEDVTALSRLVGA